MKLKLGRIVLSIVLSYQKKFQGHRTQEAGATASGILAKLKSQINLINLRFFSEGCHFLYERALD